MTEERDVLHQGDSRGVDTGAAPGEYGRGRRQGGDQMRRALEIGGYLAAVVLVAFGIGALVLSIQGKNTVKDSLSAEQIVGSPDMTPDEITKEAQQAGLKNVDVPDCDVADEKIDTGGEAKCFADYMRIHALEASGGQTYARMPRYATDDGKGTNDPAQASKDASGNPVSNGARDLWVTETALATALNVSYMADQLGNFGIVVGIALILAGVGFAILAYTALHASRGGDAPAT
jgi:hypothetical protein